jgi:L-alanine-DL-glutamate epimerase-like enolase superfamily enzyme
VSFAAAVHMAFSQPNTLIQESVRSFYTGWYQEVVTTLPRIADGYVYPMEGDGLGLEMRDDIFDRKDIHVMRSTL